MNVEIFVKKQLELLQIEKEEDILVRQKLLETLSNNQLQQCGLALTKLRLSSSRTGLGGKTLVDFEACPSSTPSGSKSDDSGNLPAHQLKNGDIVKLDFSTGKEDEAAASSPITGVVYKVTDKSICVAFGEQTELPDGIDNRILKLMCDALKQLQDPKFLSSAPHLQVFFGRNQPSFEVNLGKAELEEPESNGFYDPNLNSSQRRAVRFCLAAQEVSFIHGPPGTGKTFTLIEIILQLLKPKLSHFNKRQGKPPRILLCAPSNIAVDNLVERVISASSKNNYKLSLTRLGHPARMLESVWKHSLDYRVQTDDGTQLASDIRREMDDLLSSLGKSKKGVASKKKSAGGPSRREMYAELKTLRKEYRQRESQVLSRIISPEGSQVVACTLNGAGQRKLANQTFDIVIIDEANQALQAECLIAMNKAQRVIFAGDPYQLPPTVLSEKAAKMGLEETVFDTLKRLQKTTDTNSLMTMLTIQYRMNEKIMKWSSDEFYESKLTAHSSVATHLVKDLEFNGKGESIDPMAEEISHTPIMMIDTTGSSIAYESLDDEFKGKLTFGGGGGDSGSKSNSEEANLVVAHIRVIIKELGIPASQVAVITPYNAQVTLLNSLLKGNDPDYAALEIGSVDGFQGREKELVVISLVRCNDDHEIGFLKEKRRLNVAITRARRHCCIIGNGETLSSDPFFERLIDYIGENGEIRYSAEQ